MAGFFNRLVLQIPDVQLMDGPVFERIVERKIQWYSSLVWRGCPSMHRCPSQRGIIRGGSRGSDSIPTSHVESGAWVIFVSLSLLERTDVSAVSRSSLRARPKSQISHHSKKRESYKSRLLFHPEFLSIPHFGLYFRSLIKRFFERIGLPVLSFHTLECNFQ